MGRSAIIVTYQCFNELLVDLFGFGNLTVGVDVEHRLVRAHCDVAAWLVLHLVQQLFQHDFLFALTLSSVLHLDWVLYVVSAANAQTIQEMDKAAACW